MEASTVNINAQTTAELPRHRLKNSRVFPEWQNVNKKPTWICHLFLSMQESKNLSIVQRLYACHVRLCADQCTWEQVQTLKGVISHIKEVFLQTGSRKTHHQPDHLTLSTVKDNKPNQRYKCLGQTNMCAPAGVVGRGGCGFG